MKRRLNTLGMNILPDSCRRAMLHETDKRIRANIASRQEELANLSGVARAWKRIRIEVWAWRKALREVEVRRGI